MNAHICIIVTYTYFIGIGCTLLMPGASENAKVALEEQVPAEVPSGCHDAHVQLRRTTGGGVQEVSTANSPCKSMVHESYFSCQNSEFLFSLHLSKDECIDHDYLFKLIM